jgi:4-carboxymuconolactone decarboxylase
MARIPYADPPAGTRAAEAVARTPLNVMRMLAHSEEGSRAFSKMGGAILDKSTLDKVLKELAILRTGHLLKSDYETFQHERIARRAGMNDAQIQGARTGKAEGLTEDDKLIIAFAEEFHAGKVGDATFAKAKARFSHAELVDLAIACGFYGLVSRFLNTFEVEIEENPPVVR